MESLLSNKTNKRANNIFQMKTQIRLRAEALRRQEARGSVAVLHHAPRVESGLFRYATPVQYQTVGKELYDESD